MSMNVEEPDSFAAGGGGDESGYQYDNSASYYGQQIPYGKTIPNAIGGNGASAEQSSYESDLSGPDSQHFELDPATQTLIEELKAETAKLDPGTNRHAVRLIKNEIERLSQCYEPEYLEVDIPKPIKVVRKVIVPVHRNPKFNFVGKLLGPGGKTLQNLIHSTRCRIYILGRGSSREKAKEEELLSSGDPKYAHLKDPLYVRVESSGPPAMAYQKIAHVLNELQYYLQPVKDDIYMQQMADMGKPVIPPPGVPPTRGGMRGSLMGTAPPMRGGVAPRGGPRGAAPRGRGYLIQTPPGPGHAAGPPPTSAPSGPPPNYVTYPGYDYGNYGEYQQPVPPPPQPPAQHYGNVQGPPPPGPPVPPIPPPVGVPPGPPSAPAQAPPPAHYASNSAYNYPYGYDYSQYNPHSNVHTQGPPPRVPGPPVAMPPGGGGKAPPMGRGRGMPRPAPY